MQLETRSKIQWKNENTIKLQVPTCRLIAENQDAERSKYVQQFIRLGARTSVSELHYDSICCIELIRPGVCMAITD